MRNDGAGQDPRGLRQREDQVESTAAGEAHLEVGPASTPRNWQPVVLDEVEICRGGFKATECMRVVEMGMRTRRRQREFARLSGACLSDVAKG